MAFEDIENQECLCAWVAFLGDQPKQYLSDFISSVKMLIQIAKATYMLIYSLPEELLRKLVMENVLQAMQQTTQPLEAPFAFLVSMTEPFADCPPIATVNSAIKTAREATIGDIDEMEYAISQYIDSLDELEANTEFFDQLIGILDDVQDAIDKC